MSSPDISGILLVDKPVGKTSFSLIGALRRILGVKKIGHAGTLDPFATGVMILLIGRQFTRLSDQFLCDNKEYVAEMHLGITTDSYDCDGTVTATSSIKPTREEIDVIVAQFQGEVEQVPPMFSAKKINGKKLYELARQGKEIERKAVKVNLETEILDYTYPHLTIRVNCSKGTYIRSIAHDMGVLLGCGAHLTKLRRTRSGTFNIDQCLDGSLLFSTPPATEKIKESLFIPTL